MQERRKIYSFAISEDLLKRLKQMAVWECRSTAGMLRVLVRSGVEAFEAERAREERGEDRPPRGREKQ